jgi:hypothetical protein
MGTVDEYFLRVSKFNGQSHEASKNRPISNIIHLSDTLLKGIFMYYGYFYLLVHMKRLFKVRNLRIQQN